MKKIILVTISILFVNSVIIACSMAPGVKPPIFNLDKEKYVFVGEVIGYTETIKSDINLDDFTGKDKFYGEGNGYKIKPLASFNMPNHSVDYFELFTFGVTTWCAPQIRKAQLPIGTKFRIIANESTLIPNRSPEYRIRLETKIFDRLSVVSKDDTFITNQYEKFDYKKLKSPYEKFIETKDYESMQRLNDFIVLEIYKDLSRLKNSTSKNERYNILERLLYAPGVHYSLIINPRLGELNSIYDNFARIPPLNNENPVKNKEKLLKEIKLTKKEEILIQKRKEILDSDNFKYLKTWYISY